MTKNTVQMSLAAVALIAAALIVFFYATQPAHADNANTSSTFTTATSSKSFSVTTSAQIIATTSNWGAPNFGPYRRMYATVCNPNSNPVAINLDQDKPANLATGHMTYLIAAATGYSVCYTITPENLYQGAVEASSTNQTATTVYVSDYQQ